MHDESADLGVVVRLERAQNAVLLHRQMFEWVAFAAKNIMIKKGLPGGPLGQRALSDGDHAEEKAGVGGIRSGGERIPPVVDEPVERGQGFDLMPPEFGDVE